MNTKMQHKQNVDVGFGMVMLLMAAMLVAGVLTGAPLPEVLRIVGFLVAVATAGFGVAAIAPYLHEHKAVHHQKGRH